MTIINKNVDFVANVATVVAFFPEFADYPLNCVAGSKGESAELIFCGSEWFADIRYNYTFAAIVP